MPGAGNISSLPGLGKFPWRRDRLPTSVNACITSGRDFLFTDIDAIDAGSREWLKPQGIQSLIATPIVGENSTVCGFAGFDFVRAPCREFTDRILFNIHEAANLLLNCQMQSMGSLRVGHD